MYDHQQEATCGLQLCQHPLCWATNRQAARGLLHLQGSKSSLHKSFSVGKVKKEYLTDAEEESAFEALPTVTILNMIDDYGANGNDLYPSANFSSFADERSRDHKPRKSVNIPEPSKIVPKLSLKSITTSQSAEDVTAPANTPLQSSYGFGDYRQEYRSPLGHLKYDSHKPNFTEISADSTHGSDLRTRASHCGKVQLEIHDEKVAGLSRKKLFVWCPPKTRRSRGMQFTQVERLAEIPALREVSLPLNFVPEFHPTPTSHKAIKATLPKKTQNAFATARKRAVHEAASAGQPQGPHAATPREITQLRRVPADVLIRVLHRAEENGIISKTQTNLLLTQVVGKSHKLPSIKETLKSTVGISARRKPEEIAPETPLETKNSKILNVEEAQIHSPQTASVSRVYRMDSQISQATNHPSPRSIPPTMKATIVTPVEKPVVYNLDTSLADNSLVQSGRSGKVGDDKDSPYDDKPRDFTKENLRSVLAIPSQAQNPKKTPVKYVATLFDRTVPHSPPTKPFHYPKSPRDIFLGPIPSPPPPISPTEHDSMYDPQIVGSSVLVIPSMTEPSTTASFREKTSSPSESKTPTAGRWAGGRHMKTTQTKSKGSQRCQNLVLSPFGSESGHDGWPQVNEDDFMRAAVSSELAESPIPSFTEEDLRVISRNESASTPRDEASLPGTEKFPTLRQGEILSPAPPPPSPEPLTPVVHQSAKETSRVGGAATALGLLTLEQNSLQPSPETNTGFTPTPIVSSVQSDNETPGWITKSQTVGSTPAIPGTPFERDSGETDLTESKNLTEGMPNSVDKTIPVPRCSDDFEVGVCPDIAKQELEKEMEKL